MSLFISICQKTMLVITKATEQHESVGIKAQQLIETMNQSLTERQSHCSAEQADKCKDRVRGNVTQLMMSSLLLRFTIGNTGAAGKQSEFIGVVDIMWLK